MENKNIETAIRSLNQLIAVVDSKTGSLSEFDHNKELENLTKSTTYEDFRSDLYFNIHPADREAFAAFSDIEGILKNLKSRVHIAKEFRIRHSNRRYYWSEITMCNSSLEDSPRGDDFLLLIRDIHSWKSRELKEDAQLRSLLKDLQDRYDDLFEENMKDEQTGCYNRKGLKYYTDIIIRQAKDTGNLLFICVADLNGLKYINDTYGHAAGDEAIAEVSSELLRSAPEGSRIVRTGGDEFLLMASLPEGSTAPDEMGTKLDAGLESYNKNNPRPYRVGASYGYVFLPLKEGMTDLDEYIEIADKKMYEMRVQRDEHRRA